VIIPLLLLTPSRMRSTRFFVFLPLVFMGSLILLPEDFGGVLSSVISSIFKDDVVAANHTA
jgi:hypothetical protein